MSDEKKSANLIEGIIGLVVVVAGIWFFFGGGLEYQAEKEMNRIEQQVAAEQVKQYEIAKRSGSAMDAYVNALLVAEAYLQAEDEVNYQKWKKIEAEEARRAGMPSF